MNQREIKDGIEKFTSDAAEYIAKEGKPIKAWFPKGWIRKISDHSKRWTYLNLDRRHNIACVIQLCDINRFHLALWEIKLTAGSMWAWQCTIPVIAVIETLLYEVCRQELWIKDGDNFKKCINVGNSHDIYGEKFKNELHALRDYRNEIHLFLKKGKVEMHDGKPKEYNSAVIVLKKLESYLEKYFQKRKP